jgi:hypothetical protein
MISGMKALLLVQGLYTLTTSVWPLVHLRSFEKATGSKYDKWLVKTVAALLLPVALCWLWGWWSNALSIEAVILGLGTAIGLGCIDVYYSFVGRISKIYLVDAALQILFVASWVAVLASGQHLGGSW